MSKISFADSVEFDVSSTSYCLARISTGWFVTGKNILCPVNSYEEGHRVITELNELDKLREFSKENYGSD